MGEFFRYSPIETGSANAGNREVLGVLNTEETLLFALEKAGVIKPVDMIAEPIDRIIDRGDLEDSDFGRLRDLKSLEGLQVDEQQRNTIQQHITRLINERTGYDEDQVRALKNYGQWYLRKKGLPVVQHILKALIFRDKDSDLPVISQGAEELAPEIMWMMIKEDEESKKNTENTAASAA